MMYPEAIYNLSPSPLRGEGRGGGVFILFSAMPEWLQIL